jgi:hypothetical protein
MSKVFLGGTCAGTSWRDYLILSLGVSSFNPVVKDWTPDCQAIEEYEKEMECDIHLYVITKKMTGVFSIAEVVDSANTKGKVTILHVIPEGFDEFQLRSLKAVVDLVKRTGGIAYIDSDLYRTTRVINNAFKE